MRYENLANTAVRRCIPGIFRNLQRARSERGDTLELTFVGIRSAEIARVEIDVDVVEIDVLFALRSSVRNAQQQA